MLSKFQNIGGKIQAFRSVTENEELIEDGVLFK